MTSLKQIRANRENSKNYSTGPRTEEGKAVSSRNAVKHGLTGNQIVIDGEDPEEFDWMLEGLIEDFAPETVLEHHLVEQLAGYIWRLKRIPALEAALLEVHRNAAQQENPKPYDYTKPFDPKEDRLYHLAKRYGITDEQLIETHQYVRGLAAESEGVELEALDKAPKPTSEQLALKVASEAALDLGRTLLRDATQLDALGKLTRHEAHLANALRSVTQQLETLRARWAKDRREKSEVLDLVVEKIEG